MAAFLSAEWLSALNDTLRNAGPPPLENLDGVYRLVLELTDGPSSLPHALTLTVEPEGATVEIGDHLAADAVIRLTFRDAEALTNGTLESATALREGRLKLRGDVHALLPLVSWLVQAHEG
jgi:hypothetical protein